MDNGMNKINQKVEKQQTKVIGLIDKVLEELSLEIEARKTISGIEIPSVLQLESISNDLIKMKNVLSPKNYKPTYTRQIVDSWENYSKLGDKLLSVAQEYFKLN